MKGYELLDAVGGIDSRIIEAAERETKRRKGWIGWIAAAACVGLAVMNRLERAAGFNSVSV